MLGLRAYASRKVLELFGRARGLRATSKLWLQTAVGAILNKSKY